MAAFLSIAAALNSRPALSPSRTPDASEAALRDPGIGWGAVRAPATAGRRAIAAIVPTVPATTQDRARWRLPAGCAGASEGPACRSHATTIPKRTEQVSALLG